MIDGLTGFPLSLLDMGLYFLQDVRNKEHIFNLDQLKESEVLVYTGCSAALGELAGGGTTGFLSSC